jgi:hypothetical protein
MTHPAYLRDKALKLRTARRMSIDEIALRLGLPKTTIYYWVRDLPLGRPRRHNNPPGNLAMQAKHRKLREAAYAEGRGTFDRLCTEPTFRDFVCMYIGEGYKRNRNTVALGNSDPRVVKLAARWIRRFSRNPVTYYVQYHADQDLRELKGFWSNTLGVSLDDIHVQRKSNSNGLAARTWRSLHGVLTVRACDTLFRARLQGWIDRVEETWG